MSTSETNHDRTQRSKIDGHRLTEFVYGTVTAMVAVAAFGGGHSTGWWEAATIIVVGAVAVWLAHAYSTLLSKRLTGGRRLEARDLAQGLSGSWPIVTAGILVALPVLPAALGIYSLDTGLTVAGFLGIAILGLMGYLAGVVIGETLPRRLLSAALSAAVGAVVVLIEWAVHH